MDSNSDSIVVFSFASSEQNSRLSGQLLNLGYPLPDIVSKCDTLLRLIKNRTPAPLILLLGDNLNPKKEFLTLLPEIRKLPTLGLFTEKCPFFIPPVVKACSEFEIFPCSKKDLERRLGRVVNREQQLENFEDDSLFKLNMVGDSNEFRQIIRIVRKVVQCDAPVFIDGETGTGKELVARAIHHLGDRKNRPFVAANCGAIPDQLVENELFGHEKGAFTDAREDREGLVTQAEGGTLFLDEIETLSQKGQVVLLRFLENRTYRPLGGCETRQANIRIVAATNESITRLVQEGEFRKDLYYRINVMKIPIPPLRERHGDINLLAEHFIRHFQEKYGEPNKRLHPDSLTALNRYDWPGNVREMENMLHREFLMAEDNTITLADLTAAVSHDTLLGERRREKLMQMPMVNAKDHIVSNFEKEYLEDVLWRTRGNVSQAARLAGKERRSFARLLEKYGINRHDFKSR